LLGLSVAFLIFTSSSLPAPPQICVERAFLAQRDDVACEVLSHGGRILESVEPGGIVYFPIENALRSQDVEGWRVIIDDWISGQQLVKESRIEYIEVFDNDKLTSLGKFFAAAIYLNYNGDSPDGFVNARISVTQRRSGAKYQDFSFVVRSNRYSQPDDSIICGAPDAQLSFFEKTQLVSLVFSDFARFDVDVATQSTVNVGFSSKPYTDIVAAYPNARLEFLSWIKRPIFNQTGRLFLYANEDSAYLYELINGSLILSDAEYSKDDKAFVILSRRLGDYIVSDQILADPVTAVSHPNPPTGISC
jgi:hypothetical protein